MCVSVSEQDPGGRERERTEKAHQNINNVYVGGTGERDQSDFCFCLYAFLYFSKFLHKNPPTVLLVCIKNKQGAPLAYKIKSNLLRLTYYPYLSRPSSLSCPPFVLGPGLHTQPFSHTLLCAKMAFSISRILTSGYRAKLSSFHELASVIQPPSR